MTASESPRRIALAIQRLAPAGGLEQHAIRLAAALADRGAAPTLVTTRTPTGPIGFDMLTLPARGRTNHGRLAAFASDAAHAVEAGDFDIAVAFHAIPGFHVLFLADPSRAQPAGLRAILPRHRAFASLERRAFDAGGGAALALMLSSAQLEAFRRNHPASRARTALLPPTLARPSALAHPPTPSEREAARRRLGLAPDRQILLWVGLQARTKGLDRALAALAATPGAHLLVTGLDPTSRSGRSMQRLAARLSLSERVNWLGFAEDMTLRDAFLAADLLVHPSRADVTGTVILEAMSNGLAVIATSICGYADHIAMADAGVVLPDPFRQGDLTDALVSATPDRVARWSTNGRAYAGSDDLYTGLERAVDLILSEQARSPTARRARG
jgi:UDP-glucose:(heptosyl)LPS alpha-1,3-glucosyltransferase